MRVVLYGVGAVGGTIAGALVRAGHDVIGIARGAQLRAIASGGLRLRTPDETLHVRFPVVQHPAEISFAGDDAVLLCMKTQDTPAALADLRAAGVTDQPIFCAQNGVTNEGLALRFFPNVHGIAVMLPALFTKPGEVAAFGTPRHGILDCGRYPAGQDGADQALADLFTASNLGSAAVDNIMAAKHGKLLVNLTNITQALLGRGVDAGDLPQRLRAEAEAVYRAAGIVWQEVGADDPRRENQLKQGPIAGVERIGGSTAQSLARGTGSVETDFLNGQIVYLGRLHGVATPLNAAFCRIAAEVVAVGAGPAHLSLTELTARLDAVT